MNFTNLVDIVQVFANEYCHPASIVLIINSEFNFKEIFTFLNSETICVHSKKEPNVDFVVSTHLPFINESFDLIISFESFNLNEIRRTLKPNGNLLIKSTGFIGIENYTFNEEIFSVI